MLGGNFTTTLRVGLLFTPPLDAMCAPIGQLALDLNMSVSGFDPAISFTSAQAWASNSLPKQPTEAEVENVLRPVVKILLDPSGTPAPAGMIVDLRERDEVGRYLRSVRKTVDPESLGLDLNRALYC